MSGPLTDADFMQPASAQRKSPGAPLTDADFGAPSQSNNVVQEMPEEMQGLKGAYHRAVVKNFSNNPDSSVKYLQERYPDYQISHDKNQIYFAKPGESTRVLDPDTGLFHTNVAEHLRDLADLGTDVGEGAAQTVGAATGALAGLPEGGVGAIPGAMLGGAGAGAGANYLKQGLGKILGVPQDISHTDALISGATGAVAPLVFGTGVGAKQLAQKGLESDALKDALLSQRGVPGRVLDWGADLGPVKSTTNWLASKASGIPKKWIETFRENPELVTNAEKNPEYALNQGAGARQDIRDNIIKPRSDVGTALGAATKAIPEVDAAPAVNAIKQEIDRLKTFKPTEDVQTRISALEDAIKSKFGEDSLSSTRVPLTGENAFDVLQALKTEGKMRNGPPTPGMTKADFAKERAQATLRSGADALDKAIKPEGSVQKQLSDQYARPRDFLQTLGVRTKDDIKAYNFLKTIGRDIPTRQFAEKADRNFGTNLVGRSNEANTIETFENKSLPEGLLKNIGRRIAFGGTVGGAAGYLAGGKPGAIVGGAGGAAISGPSGIRFLLENGMPLRQMMQNPALRYPIWQLMNAEKPQRDQTIEFTDPSVITPRR